LASALQRLFYEQVIVKHHLNFYRSIVVRMRTYRYI